MGLHYAAAIAEHDDRGMYDWLTDEYSADEGKLDKVNLVKCILSNCTFPLMDVTTFPTNEGFQYLSVAIHIGFRIGSILMIL